MEDWKADGPYSVVESPESLAQVAAIVGVKLFDPESSSLTTHIDRVDDKLALLPKYVRKSTKAVKDDF